MFKEANTFLQNLNSSQEDPQADPKENVVFVNYYPISKNLQQKDHIQTSQIKEIENAVEQKIKFIIKNFLDQENQPLNIIPKKGNLDLKKFLNKRLEKLNKRTEKAINKFLKQKFDPEYGKQDEQKEKEREKLKEVLEKEKFNPLYNKDQTYDNEMYDEDDIIENENIKTDGTILVNALATQDKLYEQMDEDSDLD